MFERFTDRARKVMALANQEAQRFNHEYIGTEHILLGLIKEGSGVGANVLKNLGVDLRKIRIEVGKLVRNGPETLTMGKLPQTPRAKRVIEYAIEEARNLNHDYVGTEHLLLGLLREQDGVAGQVLLNLGLKLEQVREEVLKLSAAGEEATEALCSVAESTEPPAPELPQEAQHHPLVHHHLAIIAAMTEQLQRSLRKEDHAGTAEARIQVAVAREQLRKLLARLATDPSFGLSDE